MEATKLKNYHILEAKGRKIAVIGYLTPEATSMSETGNVTIEGEIECIRKEIESLKRQGINIFIALGHSGFDVDKKIAAEVEDLDLVIGGHTDTFLYTGNAPDIEKPEGPYPVVVVQPKTNRKVYVVQAYGYTKYLGNLFLTFDAQGEIKNITGNPILVDNSVEQAKDVLQELNKYLEKDKDLFAAVGETLVLLQGNEYVCELFECNFGNLATDAMIKYVSHHLFPDYVL